MERNPTEYAIKVLRLVIDDAEVLIFSFFVNFNVKNRLILQLAADSDKSGSNTMEKFCEPFC